MGLWSYKGSTNVQFPCSKSGEGMLNQGDGVLNLWIVMNELGGMVDIHLYLGRIREIFRTLQVAEIISI